MPTGKYVWTLVINNCVVLTFEVSVCADDSNIKTRLYRRCFYGMISNGNVHIKKIPQFPSNMHGSLTNTTNTNKQMMLKEKKKIRLFAALG